MMVARALFLFLIVKIERIRVIAFLLALSNEFLGSSDDARRLGLRTIDRRKIRGRVEVRA
jgi:hypothetical protein